MLSRETVHFRLWSVTQKRRLLKLPISFRLLGGQLCNDASRNAQGFSFNCIFTYAHASGNGHTTSHHGAGVSIRPSCFFFFFANYDFLKNASSANAMIRTGRRVAIGMYFLTSNHLAINL